MIRILGILILVSSFLACSRKKTNLSEDNSERIELTPFKITKVILKDTQLVKTMFFDTDSGRMSITDYQDFFGKEYAYLDYTSFNAFRKTVWALVNNPKSKVFVNPMTTASSLEEVRDRVIRCEMIEESSFDRNGDEVVQSKYFCDSLTAIKNINMIRFFEAWYFNPKNNMIERELLGYSIHEYVTDKNAFRELFDVFVNDEALAKAKKYYFLKQ